MNRHLVACFCAFLLVSAGCQQGGAPAGPVARGDSDPPVGASETDLLVGAHYYLWYPANFAGGGYLRAKLSPPQQPLLGEYSSSSPAVVAQHIAWASESGIDFFTLDWWPSAPQRNALIDQVVLAAPNIAAIRFCIFYELGDLGYDAASGHLVFDESRVERFLSNMDEISSRYFDHPSYLKVGGRPVIVLYVTRTATGLFAEAMSRFRLRMAGRGINPYVIGDEIFWSVARDDGAGFTAEPQLSRIALFDALTAYNLYDSTRTSQAGYGASSTFVSDARALYERYREAAGDTPLVPLAFPGYNDRGVRLQADHYAIPREWSPGAGEGSFFAEWLERFTLPLIDARFPMMLITSWNEWNEDTAIEPAAESAPTTTDTSPSGTTYTQGYRYAGYGRRYLDVLCGKACR